MAERPSRYSVQITLDQDLLKVKGKTHDLCCAWGFTWNNSKDPIYNVIGWTSAENSHTKTIAPIKTIAWNETHSITASEYGRRHGVMVDKAMEPVPIAGGQEFIVRDFVDVQVNKDVDTLDRDAFGYRIDISCSVVLNMALDLHGSVEDNTTPVFIASDGVEPLDLSEKAGTITPTRTLLFFFAKKDTLKRRQGLDFNLLENLPIIYDYGNQSTPWTKIKLIYKDSKPQLSPDIQGKKDESFLLVRQPILRLDDMFENIPLKDNNGHEET